MGAYGTVDSLLWGMQDLYHQLSVYYKGAPALYFSMIKAPTVPETLTPKPETPETLNPKPETLNPHP